MDKGDLAESLEAIARLRIEQVMTPNGLRLQRIINTESYRFPEIFTANFEQSGKPVIDFVAGLLDAPSPREKSPLPTPNSPRPLS